MTILCSKCNTENPDNYLICRNCNTPNSIILDRISLLEKAQDDLKKDFYFQSEHIKSELEKLKALLSTDTIRLKTEKPEKDATPGVVIKPEVPQDKKTPVPDYLTQQKALKPIPKEKLVVNKPKAPKKNRNLEQTSALAGVFFEGSEFIHTVYEKYKTEGKLPIFFMTIAGTVAILFGAGYFLQYSLQFVGHYDELIKLSLGAIASLTVLFVGKRLYKKDTKYNEFASALIALSLSLNYILIYYGQIMEHFPILSNALTGFLLIAANSGIAIWMSIKHKTKIVACLFLIGASFAPFYLNSSGDGSVYYGYLYLIVLASLFLSHLIKWTTLSYLAFTVSALLLGSLSIIKYPSSLIFLIYYHLFAYTFYYFAFAQGKKLREKMNVKHVVIICANTVLFMWNLYAGLENQLPILGVFYGINALFFILAGLKSKESKDGRLSMFTIGFTLIALAIPSILDQSLFGLFWCLEGLLILFMASRLKFYKLKLEGFALLLIGQVKLLYSASEIVSLEFSEFWTTPVINLLLFGFVLITTLFTNKSSDTQLEYQINRLIKQLIPLWFVATFYLISNHYIGEYSLLLTPVLIGLLLMYGKALSTNFSYYIAVSMSIPLVLYYSYSISITQSFHFSDQPLLAQLLIGEWLIFLGGLKYVNKWLKIENVPFNRFAQGTYESFLIIVPLLIISFTNRHFSELVPVSIWITCMSLYGLFKWKKYTSLFIASNLLIIFAFFGTISQISVLGALAGIASVITVLFLEKGFKETSNTRYQLILITSPIITATLTLTILISFELWGGAFTLFSLILLLSIANEKRLPFTKNMMAVYMALANLGIFINLIYLFTFKDPISFLTAINIALVAYLLKDKQITFDKMQIYSMRWMTIVLANQVQILFLYTSISYVALDSYMGPMTSLFMVVHAIILIVLAIKNSIKIMNIFGSILFLIVIGKVIFVDTRDFETMEKVLVLLGMGVLLLLGSFIYIRVKKKYTDS